MFWNFVNFLKRFERFGMFFDFVNLLLQVEVFSFGTGVKQNSYRPQMAMFLLSIVSVLR